MEEKLEEKSTGDIDIGDVVDVWGSHIFGNKN